MMAGKKTKRAVGSPYAIPKNWRQVRGTIVLQGDWIKSPEGWERADQLGKSQVAKSGVKSAVGHPTALYECVIRADEVECFDCNGKGTKRIGIFRDSEVCETCEGRCLVRLGDPMDGDKVIPA